MRGRWAAGLVALLAFGCGGSKVVPVSGKVTLDGVPLANAKVNFQPLGNGKINPGLGSYAKTNDQGEYSLMLVDQSGPGAIVGKHRVEISAFESEKRDPNDDRERQPPDKVPARYNVKSELTFEVPPGGTTKADFPLTTR
jgi:hypothetical protein